jgi:RNA polymerase sigma-70 factor (ECF subfamily)
MNKKPEKVSISKTAAQNANTGDITDLELVMRCQKGDNSAFTMLVNKYQHKIYTVALGIVKNPDDAMDISQDAFVKVHRYLKNFQGTSSFFTWLYRIVVNLCIDHIRKHNKYIKDEFDEKIHSKNNTANSKGGGVLSSNAGSSPSYNLDRKELAQMMQDSISKLPPYHRAVILMREVEGMSYSDMAAVLKISKGTVMSRLHHARQKLQQELKPYLEGNIAGN